MLADGRLASGGNSSNIKLWPKENKREPMVLSNGEAVYSLAVLADGRLASGGILGTIKLWPKDGTGEPVVLVNNVDVSPRVHSLVVLGRPAVDSLAVMADGRLASGSYDGTIKLWPKEASGAPVVLSHGSPVWSMTGLPDGRLASGGEDGTIKLWLVDEQKLIAALCLRAGRNLSNDEWARYIGSDTPWQPSCRSLPSNWWTPAP